MKSLRPDTVGKSISPTSADIAYWAKSAKALKLGSTVTNLFTVELRHVQQQDEGLLTGTVSILYFLLTVRRDTAGSHITSTQQIPFQEVIATVTPVSLIDNFRTQFYEVFPCPFTVLSLCDASTRVRAGKESIAHVIACHMKHDLSGFKKTPMRKRGRSPEGNTNNSHETITSRSYHTSSMAAALKSVAVAPPPVTSASSVEIANTKDSANTSSKGQPLSKNALYIGWGTSRSRAPNTALLLTALLVPLTGNNSTADTSSQQDLYISRVSSSHAKCCTFVNFTQDEYAQVVLMFYASSGLVVDGVHCRIARATQKSANPAEPKTSSSSSTSTTPRATPANDAVQSSSSSSSIRTSVGNTSQRAGSVISVNHRAAQETNLSLVVKCPTGTTEMQLYFRCAPIEPYLILPRSLLNEGPGNALEASGATIFTIEMKSESQLKALREHLRSPNCTIRGQTLQVLS